MGELQLETLRPAFDGIEARLVSLMALRDRPAGTIRINTSEHAAHSVLWPAISRLTSTHPDIRVELDVQSGLVDIVAGRFDAGVRLGERLEQDMIAMRIGPRLRMASVASPSYFAQRGEPSRPDDLAGHNCINLRMASGGLYVWEFEQNGHEVKVKVEGQLVLNDTGLILDAAIAGHGIAHLVEDRVAPNLADGSLVRVLEDWCGAFDGYYLYYPSRRQPSSAFALLLETLRYKD